MSFHLPKADFDYQTLLVTQTGNKKVHVCTLYLVRYCPETNACAPSEKFFISVTKNIARSLCNVHTESQGYTKVAVKLNVKEYT